MQFSKNKKNIQWDKYMVYIIFVAVFILFAIILGNKGFLQPRNLINILRQTAMISVMAVAGVFVMAAGQIVGCINGLLVTKLKLPAFLATLGTMELVRGAAMWITDTAAVPIDNKTFCTVFGIGSAAGIPVLVLWTILFYIIGILIFNKCAFGRHILATGGNENSAIYSGINTVKVKIIAFTMSGAFAAFAGIMYAARMQAGRYSYGDGDEMSVIAAVVLGGTAMSGGTGSVIGALFGSVLMGMMNNAVILANLSSAQQTMIKGGIIILAVAISNLSQRKKNN